MNFLAPAFLAGLAAIAVPVIIHLIHRERRVVVEFPSLMFLQRIPYRSVRRQKLRHLLLLVLRCAALALLVAAFARPFFERHSAAITTSGAKEVVVLLDRSASMAYGDRWSRAQAAARKTVRALSGADRATLVLFDDDAIVASEPMATPDRVVGRDRSREARRRRNQVRARPQARVADHLGVDAAAARSRGRLRLSEKRVGEPQRDRVSPRHEPSRPSTWAALRRRTSPSRSR